MNKRKILAVLTCMVSLMLSLTACGGEKYDWPDNGISTRIPQPKSNTGEIIEDSDESFYMSVDKCSKEDYDEYIKECQAKGFIVESEKGSSSYSAYNEEGYEIDLYYYENDKELSISLYAPEQMGELFWPTNGMATLLPIPDSTVGNVKYDSSDYVSIYIGDITKDEFSAYVQKTSEMGFDVDYDKNENSYNAYNEEGYEVYIIYEGANVMRIEMNAPEIEEMVELEEQESSLEEDTSVEATEQETEMLQPEEEQMVANETANAGIRPEFKEAMDSYEAFFDEYVEFMKKYSESDDIGSMLMDYMDYMTQYAETMEKMESIDESELSTEEALYYAEVTGRITQKLMSVGQ